MITKEHGSRAAWRWLLTLPVVAGLMILFSLTVRTEESQAQVPQHSEVSDASSLEDEDTHSLIPDWIPVHWNPEKWGVEKGSDPATDRPLRRVLAQADKVGGKIRYLLNGRSISRAQYLMLALARGDEVHYSLGIKPQQVVVQSRKAGQKYMVPAKFIRFRDEVVPGLEADQMNFSMDGRPLTRDQFAALDPSEVGWAVILADQPVCRIEVQMLPEHDPGYEYGQREPAVEGPEGSQGPAWGGLSVSRTVHGSSDGDILAQMLAEAEQAGGGITFSLNGRFITRDQYLQLTPGRGDQVVCRRDIKPYQIFVTMLAPGEPDKQKSDRTGSIWEMVDRCPAGQTNYNCGDRSITREEFDALDTRQIQSVSILRNVKPNWLMVSMAEERDPGYDAGQQASMISRPASDDDDRVIVEGIEEGTTVRSGYRSPEVDRTVSVAAYSESEDLAAKLKAVQNAPADARFRIGDRDVTLDEFRKVDLSKVDLEIVKDHGKLTYVAGTVAGGGARPQPDLAVLHLDEEPVLVQGYRNQAFRLAQVLDTIPESVRFFLDGEEVDKAEVMGLQSERIESVSVMKDRSAVYVTTKNENVPADEHPYLLDKRGKKVAPVARTADQFGFVPGTEGLAALSSGVKEMRRSAQNKAFFVIVDRQSQRRKSKGKNSVYGQEVSANGPVVVDASVTKGRLTDVFAEIPSEVRLVVDDRQVDREAFSSLDVAQVASVSVRQDMNPVTIVVRTSARGDGEAEIVWLRGEISYETPFGSAASDIRSGPDGQVLVPDVFLPLDMDKVQLLPGGRKS